MNKKVLKIVIAFSLTAISLGLIYTNYLSYRRDRKIYEDYSHKSSEASSVIDNILERTSPFERDSDIHGSVNGNLYYNIVLQFSFTIPDNWTVWQIDEMNSYCESLNSYKRHVIDPDNPVLPMLNDEYYDLICTDDENHIISILFVYCDNPNSTDNVDIYDYTINEITEESQKEFDNDPTVISATHDPAIFCFIDDQQVYQVNWTIQNSDGSVTYRTEIIDYANPCIRVIAIEYDDPSDFDEISSGISYYGGNEEPNTLNTTQTQQ